MAVRLLLAVLVAVVPLMQATLINRLPFSGLDLVALLAVTAGLARGPGVGAVVGFWAGLLADLVPSAHHTVGRTALILCLVGYACGRLGETRPLPWKFAVAALGVLAAAVMEAGLGFVLGDPGTTAWPVIARVLPGTLLPDLVAVPAVVGLAYLLGRRTHGEARHA